MAGALQIWDFGGTSYVTVLGVDIEHALQAPGSGTQTTTLHVVGPEATLASGLLSGRTFKPGDRGVAVADLHYARFFNLQPGAKVTVDGVPFDLIGIVELRNGSQAAAANLYLPLADAQSLVGLGPDQVNQVYVRVANAGKVDTVVARLTRELGNISVMTEDSLLQVMGGIGQVSARFSLIAATVGLLGGLIVSLGGPRRTGGGAAPGNRRHEGGRLAEPPRRAGFSAGSFPAQPAGRPGGLLARVGRGVVARADSRLPDTITAADQTIQSMAMVQTAAQNLTLPARVDMATLALAILASVGGGTFAGWTSARRAAKIKPAQSLRLH